VAWAKAFGGSSYDGGSAVAVRSDGMAVVTGDFKYTASFGATTLTAVGSQDVFVTSLNGDGSVAWAKAFGGLSNDYGRGVAVRSDGTAVVTGGFEGTASFAATTLTAAGSTGVFEASLGADGSA
jgi:hypothetical protein